MRFAPALPLCVLLIWGGPVAADITAAELFAAADALARTADGALSARKAAGPGALVLHDLTFTHRDGTRVVFGPVTLTETPDRAVVVTLPEQFDLVVMPAAGLASVAARRVVFRVAVPGFHARITGLDPEEAGLEIRAASVSVTLDQLEPALPTGQSLSFALAGADLALAWDQAPRGTLQGLAARADLGTLHADLSYLLLDAARGRSRGEIALDLAALTARVDFAGPADLGARTPPEGRDAGDVLEVLGLGTRFDLSAASGAFALYGTIEEPPALGADDGGDGKAGEAGPIRFEALTESAGATLAFDAARVEYATSLGRGRVRMTGRIPDQPFDDAGLAWAGYRSFLRVGLGTMVDPQPWSLGLELLHLELLGEALSGQLWAMADPAGVLPHDPATLIVNLSGRYAADPKGLLPGGWQRGEDMPLAALSVVLDKVLLSALGVEITATGAVDLDFSKVEREEDLPEPLGKLSMLTKGANALIERLSASGLVAPEDLQSLRFGLLFIGRAGAEPDTLETVLEFGEGGAFSLNGQRLK